MNEFALALQSLTEAHHKWELPPAPPAIVRPAEPVARNTRLSPRDEKALARACKRIAKHSTGRIVFDPASGFYVAIEK